MHPSQWVRRKLRHWDSLWGRKEHCRDGLRVLGCVWLEADEQVVCDPQGVARRWGPLSGTQPCFGPCALQGGACQSGSPRLLSPLLWSAYGNCFCLLCRLLAVLGRAETPDSPRACFRGGPCSRQLFRSPVTSAWSKRHHLCRRVTPVCLSLPPLRGEPSGARSAALGPCVVAIPGPVTCVPALASCWSCDHFLCSPWAGPSARLGGAKEGAGAGVGWGHT